MRRFSLFALRSRHLRSLGIGTAILFVWYVGIGPVRGQAPTYSTTVGDAITGDNQFIAADGKHYWTVDPGADRYQNDFYERPTVQNYQNRNLVGGGQAFASQEYFGYLDLTQGRVGFDSQYLYVSLQLFSLNKVTDNGTQTLVGLIERYGFRLGLNAANPSSAGGYLFYVDNPANKSNPTTFNGDKAFGFHDTNNDVGGTGLNVTKHDNAGEVSGNGYDEDIISNGQLGGAGDVILFSRIDPTNPFVVEFALNYLALGLTLQQIANFTYLEIEANKGTKDPANYLWNDEYTKSEAGSPYAGSGGLSEFGTQGLGNIYELDTLRIPEPSTLCFVGLGLAALVGLIRRRKG